MHIKNLSTGEYLISKISNERNVSPSGIWGRHEDAVEFTKHDAWKIKNYFNERYEMNIDIKL